LPPAVDAAFLLVFAVLAALVLAAVAIVAGTDAGGWLAAHTLAPLHQFTSETAALIAIAAALTCGQSAFWPLLDAAMLLAAGTVGWLWGAWSADRCHAREDTRDYEEGFAAGYLAGQTADIEAERRKAGL